MNSVFLAAASTTTTTSSTTTTIRGRPVDQDTTTTPWWWWVTSKPKTGNLFSYNLLKTAKLCGICFEQIIPENKKFTLPSVIFLWIG